MALLKGLLISHLGVKASHPPSGHSPASRTGDNVQRLGAVLIGQRREVVRHEQLDTLEAEVDGLLGIDVWRCVCVRS